MTRPRRSIAAILAVAINVTLAIALAGPLGLPGIGLAITLGSLAEASLLLLILWYRRPTLRPSDLVRSAARAIATGLIATGAAFLVGQAITNVVGSEPGKVVLFFQLAAMGLTGALVYAACAIVLRTPEMSTIWDLATGLLRRRTISA